MSRLFLLVLLMSALVMQGYVVRAQADEDGDDSNDANEDTETDNTQGGADSDNDGEGEGEGQASEGGDVVEDQPIGPAENADVHVIFPDYPEQKFPAGSVVDAIIGFHNKGESPYVLQYMRGSFHRPQDYANIQNFSVTSMETLVEPNQHVTLMYRFKVHESFEPQDFAFQLIMLLVDNDKNQYVQPLFNNTVSVVDAEVDPFGPGLPYYGTLAALIIAVAYVALQTIRKPTTTTKRVGAKVETGTKTNASEDEWLQDINRAGPQRKRSTKSASEN